MNDLAARLAQRARPSAEATVMVPYLPDRPADPRIGPESPLADFGGHGEADAIAAETSLAAEEASAVAGVWSGLRPERAQPGAMSAPLVMPALPGEQAPRIAAADGRHEPGEAGAEAVLWESHVTERLIERVHSEPVRLPAPPRPETLTILSGRELPPLHPERPPEAALAGSTEPPADAPLLTTPPRERATARRRDRPDPTPLPHPPGDESSHRLSTDAAPRERAPLAPPLEAPAPTPAPAALRPRERPRAFDEPLVEPDPPTIHIGSITVEVVQASPRADARRVQAPPERPQRPAAASAASARPSRPLRTFGLRQL